jgi:hypothetical protein
LILTPKNWKSFQHYKDRAPSWIKLHKALLDDYEFSCLPIASRALAPMIWLLASEYDDGKITASIDKLAFRLHMTCVDLSEALRPLLEKGFFDASETLAKPEQNACLEKEDIEKNIDQTEKEATASAAPPDPSIPEREYFLRGREVLGNKSGAMIANLLKAKGKNVALARAALEEASQKQSPMEFVAAICRGAPLSAKPLTEFQRKQQETNDVTAQLRAYANGVGSGGSVDRILPNDPSQQPADLRSGPRPALLAVSRAPDRRGH